MKTSRKDLELAGFDLNAPAGLAEEVMNHGPHTVFLTHGTRNRSLRGRQRSAHRAFASQRLRGQRDRYYRAGDGSLAGATASVVSGVTDPDQVPGDGERRRRGNDHEGIGSGPHRSQRCSVTCWFTPSALSTQQHSASFSETKSSRNQSWDEPCGTQRGSFIVNSILNWTMTRSVSYDFKDETTLVTGSTSGIGRGIATAFAEADANVIVNSRTASDVEDTAAELNKYGDGDVIGVAADLSDETEIEYLIESVEKELGTITILVNNAAVWPEESSMIEADLEDWDFTMAVNVRSQFYASKLVAERMIERDVAGSIVNVTSQTGDRRTGGRGIYGVSNTAVNGLTWRMAHDLAQHGIRMNAVSTDVTETRQLGYEAEQIAADDPDRTAADVLTEWGEARPIGRLGQPRDLANGVLYLCSEQADYVVGTILRVSGGGNLE
jgi:NAD(P)-dependent dehydrogenase (short-subunit alcohol dehydrogenase family)